MSDIIEKLRISKEKYPNEFDNLINASEIGFKSSIENRRKQLEYYREIEQQRNEMIEALIKIMQQDDKLLYEIEYSDEMILLINGIKRQSIFDGKTWSEIKELLS